MKVCIYGAGAVGGHLAARLAKGGAQVSVVARGEHLSAIRGDGLRVETPEGLLHIHPVATESPAELGQQDIVIVAVKAPALGQIVKGIGPLLGDHTLVLFAMNGIPWWYFHGSGGPLDGTQLPRIDPGAALWSSVGPDRAVGAVAYTACTVTAPGVIKVENPRNRLILGRPDGEADERLDALAAMLRDGGLEVEVTAKIRDAVWAKLLMNLIGGSLGILTGSAMKDALCNEAVAEFAHGMATEGAAIAKGLGCDPGDPYIGLPKLAVSKHKQSILQDLELGRSMEVDAMLQMPLELARLAGVATPKLNFVLGLAVQRARAAGLYSD
ncbi:ketopantoate reductase family protein [Pseudomonas sp. GL-R-19]|uniref:ketopantoate reductase family protein n=1 Tax=Pseudomonas sp. GL-R-19 TaxID=2832391 RepID=UPI001CBF7C9E|nr:2-dehydropantoate 2-reductase [Pseudomonas sp. GL-R-19]